jgi:tetratricopeptide (TPR) repeat protein
MRVAGRLPLTLGLALLSGACARQTSSHKPELAREGRDIPVSTTSSSALTHFRAGQRALDVGRPQEARAHFQQAVAEDPSFVYGYVNLANSAASPEEFKEALDRATAVAGGSEGERLLVEINRTFLDNDAERRMALSGKLVQKYPESPRAWLNLGFTQGGLNQHAAARQSFGRALALDPNMFVAHAALGFSYLFNAPRDLEQARHQMEQCIAVAPEEAKGYENLGDVYRAMNRLEEARDAYSRALAKDAALSVARLKKGHVNSFLGNYAEARADYDSAIAGASEINKVTFANFRAFTHLHAGDPRAALSELAAVAREAESSGIPARQVNAAKIQTLTNAATIALHNDLLDDAAQVIDQLRATMRAEASRMADANYTRQQEATILLWEGRLAAHRGDFATAVQKAEESRRLVESDRNPRRLEGYHALRGLIELRQRNYRAAVDHYRQADLTTEYVRYHLTLSLEGAGNVAEAKPIFREVAQWTFNSFGFALVRGDARKRSAVATAGSAPLD